MSWSFHCPVPVFFGPGRAAEVPGLARAQAPRWLLVTGSDPARHGALEAALRSAGLLAGVCPTRGEPTVELAEEGARLARECGAAGVLSIGGGSALDAGKAMAALAPNPGPALDYIEVVGRGMPLPIPPLPWIAVPTTAGTGSEATRNAVLLSCAHRVKASLRSPQMYACAAVIDPHLQLGLPAAATASAGLDAITQLLEAFLSRGAQPWSDALCREGLRRAGPAFLRVWSTPGDLEARGEMALAALWSGVALSHAGLGAVHALAGVLGGTTGAAHGQICARLLAPVLQANLASPAPARPDLPERCAEAARLLSGDEAAGADDLPRWAADCARRCGIPRLGEMGHAPAESGAVAAQAMRTNSMRGNPADLAAGDLASVLAAAL